MSELEEMEELKQQTIEYFGTTRADFVKGGKGGFGFANVLTNILQGLATTTKPAWSKLTDSIRYSPLP